MTVQIVRFTTTEDQAGEVAAPVRRLVADLDSTIPPGVGCAGARQLPEPVTVLAAHAGLDGVAA